MNQNQDILRVQLRGTLLDLLRQIQNFDAEGLDTIIFRLEQVASHVIRLSDVNLVDNEIEHLVTDTIGKLQRVEQLNSVSHFTVGAVYSGQPGRPCLDISFDQLNYFLNYGISVPDIAQALGVSKSTVFRRMQKHGLSVRGNINPLSDEELDEKIRTILGEFPNAGYRTVISQLTVDGLKPSQMRVRESMRRVDPQGVAVRWLRLTPQRQYRVSGPLALWHIDGNHKLIR